MAAPKEQRSRGPSRVHWGLEEPRSRVEARVTGRCGRCGQRKDLEGDEEWQQVSWVALG